MIGRKDIDRRTDFFIWIDLDVWTICVGILMCYVCSYRDRDLVQDISLASLVAQMVKSLPATQEM